MGKKKEIKEEITEKHCNCKNGGKCTCGDNCTCGDECKCDGKCGCKKHIELKFVFLLILLVGVFIGGLIIGGAVLVDDKNVDSVKKENVFEYQATSNTMDILGVVSNNDNKAGTYVIDYQITGKDEEKKKISIEFEWEESITVAGVPVSGVKDDKINLVFGDKVVERVGGENTNVSINDYFGYVFVLDYSSFMPLGEISIYDLSGTLVKKFDNVVDSYYICGETLQLDDYVNLNVDYRSSYYRGTTVYMVDNFVEENYNWNWFSTPVSIYKLDFETLEVEKISEFNACFSQQ